MGIRKTLNRLILLAGLISLGLVQKDFINQRAYDTSNWSSDIEKLHAEQTVDQIQLLKQLPSLGFRNVIADWAFIQFVQYFGDDDARRRFGYNQSPLFLDAAIAHDPYHTKFYLFLSGSTTIYAGNPQTSVDITQAGLNEIGAKRADDNYLVWRYKAVDELLFLGDSQASQASFEQSANWSERSNIPDSDVISQRSRQTARFLSENPDSAQAQISAWSSILTTAFDDVTRSRAVEQIRKLGGEVVVSDDGGVSILYPQIPQADSSATNSDT